MAMVRLKVNAAVAGWDLDEIVEVERTPRVDGLIANGYCTVLAEAVPDTAADGGPAFPESLPAPADLTRSDDTAGPAWAGLVPGAPLVAYSEGDTTDAPAAAAGAHGKLSAAVAVVPPRTGKGSGAAAWRKFLDGQGIDHSSVQLEDRAALIRLWDDEAARRGM